MNLHTKLVEINSLLDLGTGVTHVEIFDIGSYRRQHGALAAMMKLRELRAEAPRQYDLRQLLTPPTRWRVISVTIPRATRCRSSRRPSPPPKRAPRRSRSGCHGRSTDPDGGESAPNHGLAVEIEATCAEPRA
jgi:hypothetical protein